MRKVLTSCSLMMLVAAATVFYGGCGGGNSGTTTTTPAASATTLSGAVTTDTTILASSVLSSKASVKREAAPVPSGTCRAFLEGVPVSIPTDFTSGRYTLNVDLSSVIGNTAAVEVLCTFTTQGAKVRRHKTVAIATKGGANTADVNTSTTIAALSLETGTNSVPRTITADARDRANDLATGVGLGGIDFTDDDAVRNAVPVALVLTSNPSGAAVTVNGQASGTTPVIIKTPTVTGGQQVTVTATSGATTQTKQLTLKTQGATPVHFDFTAGAISDTTAPRLVTANPTNPAAGAVGVAVNQKITATFTEAMDPSTIIPANFTVTVSTGSPPTTSPVAGNVTNAGTVATFTPTSNLTAGATFTATITTGVKDLAGNALASNFSWTFMTGATADTTAPRLVTANPTNPAAGAVGVAVNQRITATFTEAMDPSTITTANFTVRTGSPPTSPVAGSVSYAGTVATFTPTSNLIASTLFTATITTGVKDLAGNALASNFSWTFMTAATPDTTAPTVTSTAPLNAATGVPLNNTINATFSEAMDSSTINPANFTVTGPGTTPVNGTVAYQNNTATFRPNSNLPPNTPMTATITTGVKDLAGNALASNFSWTFMTAAAAAAGPAPVNLGTAGNFVALAKTGISTTGTTSIVGDIGVSPVAATGITGFGLILDASNEFSTSSLVTGKVYAADYAPPTPAKMTTAISDMETAYTDAAGRSTPDFTELFAGDITGRTLVPGLYKWGTGVLISGGGVTLAGGANDVWIFQIAQTLTVGNGAIVTLSGGAQAKNIFWQVAGQTTLGTTSQFKGIILCKTLIAMNTGAKLDGTALAQSAITLNANAVTKPARIIRR